MRTLRDFFFDVLDFEPNQTPNHKTNLPMKKNQSLSYMIDLDMHFDLYKELTKYVSLYRFMMFDSIGPELGRLYEIFPGYGKKPVPFKLVIDKDFEDLHYDYIGDKLHTFMNFRFGGRKYSLPIEKIAEI